MSTETVSPTPSTAYIGKDNLHAISQMSRYNQWIYDTFKSSLGSSVLEAGCGNGNITRLILKTPHLKRYVGVDLFADYCEHLRSTLTPPPGLDVRFEAINLEDPALSQLAQPLFEGLVCLNVLEHIQKDLTLLRTFQTMLCPGGRLILQVPAYPSLFGTIDAVDGHHRRYTKRGLIHLVQEAGFTIQRVTYFNMAGIPAWLWHGKIRKLQTHPSEEVRLWDQAVPFLRWLERWLPLPAGLSIFMVAERPLSCIS